MYFNPSKKSSPLSFKKHIKAPLEIVSENVSFPFTGCPLVFYPTQIGQFFICPPISLSLFFSFALLCQRYIYCVFRQPVLHIHLCLTQSHMKRNSKPLVDYSKQLSLLQIKSKMFFKCQEGINLYYYITPHKNNKMLFYFHKIKGK